MPRFAHIIGWGRFVPETVVTNHDLEGRVDTTDEWIRTRTGICERRIATAREPTSALAIHAAQRALETAAIGPEKLDRIIVATSTGDYVFPSTACLVQDALGAYRAGAFDMGAACSGFIYALSIGREAIVSGAARYVMVIGAETMSRLVNWQDRDTCVLFGDGAGAVVLAASEIPGGVLTSVLGADGSGAELLIVPASGSRHPASAETIAAGMHYVRMSGREVFRFATKTMQRAAKQVADAAEVPMDQVKLIIPHQANMRIIEAAREGLKLPPERFYSNLQRYGNTSAASIPIALCEAIEEDRIAAGDRIILVGFGGGLTWGAALVEWAVSVPTTPLPPLKRAFTSVRYRWARVRSLFRRTLRWFQGLSKTSTGHTRFLWERTQSKIARAGTDIGKMGKDVAEKTGLMGKSDDQ